MKNQTYINFCFLITLVLIPFLSVKHLDFRVSYCLALFLISSAITLDGVLVKWITEILTLFGVFATIIFCIANT